MRRELSTHWGVDQYKDRKAVIFVNTKEELFEVDYYENDKLVETREMVTYYEDGQSTVHSIHYADSAAENWCLGYMR